MTHRSGPLCLVAVLLALLGLALYSNTFDHAFHLDSGHVVFANRSIRSLGNIPRFFVDPSTFSSLRSNLDYRPVLQTSYALDHAANGYSMGGWHLTQIALHVWCSLWIFLLARFLLADEEGWKRGGIALFAALVVLVHPVHSGVVNYLSARSSLLQAAFLLPAFFLYLRRRDDPEDAGPLWGPLFLFALAILTKATAGAASATFVLVEIWRVARLRDDQASFLEHLLATWSGRNLRRLGPYLLLTVSLLCWRAHLMAPFAVEHARAPADLGSLDYLRTQVVVWWVYVRKWFVPLDLVADDATFPVIRSWLAEPLLFALLGWFFFVWVMLQLWRRDPRFLFLSASAWALLLPSSSVIPLSEMLNEHRPYLPLSLLSLVWTLPALQTALRLAGGRWIARLFLFAGLLGYLAVLGNSTWKRNQVFLTDESYWSDVVAKAPAARAWNNLGLVHLKRRDLDRALSCLIEAERLAPRWHIVQVNLALAHEARGDLPAAERHFSLAVEVDRFTGTALTERGEYRIRRGRHAEARDDLLAARPRSTEAFRLARGLTEAYAGIPNAAGWHLEFMRCLELDRPAALAEVVAMLRPFFEEPSRMLAGVDALQRLAADLPEVWWVHENLGILLGRLGEQEASDQAHTRARRLKEASSEK
jgi:protein O-mannosyl-transferase